MTELDTLRDRVAELERENQQLLTPARPRRGGWLRPTLAAVLIVAGVVLAPVAAIGAWARLELVDTASFVSTFAPLAQDPAVQSFLADEVTAAINAQVDVEGLVGEVADGIRGLGLPPRTEAALGLLEGPAAMGIQSVIGDVVTEVVASPTFADVWAQTLQLTHSSAIAVIQDSPESALALSDGGVLSVRLGVVVAAVQSKLVERGVGFAAAIPEINREVSIVQADSLTQVRAGYQAATAVGFWLPWAALVLIAGGVLVARRRISALTWAAGGLVLAFALLALGLSLGRTVFAAELSPSVMPLDAAQAIFEQLTASLRSTAVAGIVLAGLLAAGSWIVAPFRPAKALRAAAVRWFTQLGAAMRRTAPAPATDQID